MLWDAKDRQEADSFSAYAFIAAKCSASRQLTFLHLKALNSRGMESKLPGVIGVVRQLTLCCSIPRGLNPELFLEETKPGYG